MGYNGLPTAPQVTEEEEEMYHNESRKKTRQRDCAIMRITTKRGRGAVSQRDSQQSEAEELVNNKSHSKTRQENWATRFTTGHVRENWATSRATTSHGRGAVPQGEPQQVEAEGLSNY